MPNRIAYESRCTSVSLAGVSSDAEVLWDRLTVKADDFGRYDARPAVIRGACFPLKVTYWTERRILVCTVELEGEDLIRTYTADERYCLFFPTWAKYQRARASQSKYPDPPADAGIRARPRASAVIRGSRDVHVHVPEAVEVELSESKSKDAEFDAFWIVYPRHAGKRTARVQWVAALLRASSEVITDGARRYRDDPNREDQFTAHPGTWLHQDRWSDDPLPARGGPAPGQSLAARIARGSAAMHGGETE